MSDFSANLQTVNGLVVFYLCDMLFCVDIDDVFAIVNPADFPKNVKDSFLVKSNLDIDNLSIPIVELHPLFGLKNGKITPNSRFICMEIKGQAFAFVADKVEELITLNTRLGKDFEFIKIENQKFLSGKVKYGNTVFHLPNFEKIINELLVQY